MSKDSGERSRVLLFAIGTGHEYENLVLITFAGIKAQISLHICAASPSSATMIRICKL